MPGPEFFQTVMGARFYEGTVPSLVRAIATLGENVGKLAAGQNAIALAIREQAACRRKIMILPSAGGNDYQSAVLTPEGCDEKNAAAIAEEVLMALEVRDQEGNDKPDYEEWQFEDMIKALEARGFLRLDVTNGPAWDRNGA